MVGAIGHFNPRHQVLVWVGKFADHQRRSSKELQLGIGTKGKLNSRKALGCFAGYTAEDVEDVDAFP
jgi:hypothetical protein